MSLFSYFPELFTRHPSAELLKSVLEETSRIEENPDDFEIPDTMCSRCNFDSDQEYDHYNLNEKRILLLLYIYDAVSLDCYSCFKELVKRFDTSFGHELYDLSCEIEHDYLEYNELQPYSIESITELLFKVFNESCEQCILHFIALALELISEE